ncbi:protein of unknown function [Methylorubrum extorquens]|uniref:Uncharacterized protein n=1 Tax=Methylorubrum extorquens TaxID=408 RepID=A0A2N9AJ63_METEX|nr:protein of unknown function [Methylorubrum extorquens]
MSLCFSRAALPGYGGAAILSNGESALAARLSRTQHPFAWFFHHRPTAGLLDGHPNGGPITRYVRT